MIRKNKNAPLPVYRLVIPPAVRGAWRERWLWPLALLAGLIQTGGVLDTFLMSARNIRMQSLTLLDASWSSTFQVMWLRIAHAPDMLSGLSAGEDMVLSLTIVAATLVLALIAQGGLIFGIGGNIAGRKPGLRECLRAGAAHLPRVFALNVVTLGLMWLARFLMLVPLAIYSSGPTPGLALASVGTTLLYVLAVLSLTAIHFFALNAIVLQDAHVAQSVERGAVMLRDHWLVVMEVALILFGIGVLTLGGAFLAFAAIGLPVLLIMLGAALVNAGMLANFAWFVWATIFIIVMLAAGAFNISFQYRAWHLLFIRLGEGGVRAKLHRWLHALLSYGQ